ncbi:heterogeneous nuclear ribonucleoproteins A2/B1-like isoform X1 [Saccostrea echinata]|uniref:heterogeneous nuclear ribonucleoproteins A2/B1-like isoform X1 n=1 Tax=Saccostrea echinata TaxID=191078 RepID=UPI002A8311F6|nr:heterogeneous nuclear ribonucleoproteins A2/B1-like isoform X1 [Saccostrea echinata]
MPGFGGGFGGRGGGGRGGGMGGRGRGRNQGGGDPDDPEAEQYRKLFIGGLSYETTDSTLRSYFEQWGTITDCVVMTDPQTKRSRGFGFITYEKVAMLDECQANRPHKIDGREVETKRAMPREESGKSESQKSNEKMFVGGLRDTTTEDDVREAFQEYGNIKNIELIKDKATNKTRGFCFVTFDDYDPVDKCVLKKRFKICDKDVEVKKAENKNEGRGGGGGRGGRGGGHGGGWNQGGFNQGFNQGGWGPGPGNMGGDGGYQGGYGGGGGGYGGGYGNNQGGNWGGNQGGYNEGYGGGYGGGQGGDWSGNQQFGTGYQNNFGGGVMKGGGYGGQRGQGPYGGGPGGYGGGGGYAGGGGGGYGGGNRR